MYSLVKPLLIREELLGRKIRIFTFQEFIRIFKLSVYQAEYSLRALCKEGLLIRLKKALYTLKTDLPSEEEIANVLYKPSYISFEYALAYYNLIPEMAYQVTSATTKPTRLFTVNNQTFNYCAIKTEAYTGYTLVKREDRRFLVAEPEKAVIDYLYFVSLGKKSINDRMQTKGLNREKIAAYAGLYGRANLNELVKGLGLL